MPLPEDYLVYPHRAYGMDNPYHDWTPLPAREPVRLPDGIKLALTLIVPVEFFPLNPPKDPFPHPGAMKTPYPDLRHYTVRDYGNRVGVYRLMRLFDSLDIKATFAVNAAVAERYPPLLEAIRTAGHEIAAHGISTAHIHHAGLARDKEESWIERVRATFPDAVTWMSPARNESFATIGILAKHGFRVCLDWESDVFPVAFETEHGPVQMIPHYSELGDVKLLSDRSQSEEEWCNQILEAVEYSVSRVEKEGSASLALALTPYVSGQPYRIRALSGLLSKLNKIEGVRIVTAQENVSLFGFAHDESS